MAALNGYEAEIDETRFGLLDRPTRAGYASELCDEQPPLPAVAALSSEAWRENVIRLEFPLPVYFSRILDAADASDPRKFSVTPVSGAVGKNGQAARAVTVVEVQLATEGVAEGDAGRFVDLVLDRPMTPHPASYHVTATDLWSADLEETMSANLTLGSGSVYRALAPPRLDAAVPSRDISYPQSNSLAAALSGEPASFAPDGTGDYAVDEGEDSLRKRCTRRLVTKPNGFAHLPGYGVGIPDHAKRLALASVIVSLTTEAEVQIAREPEVAKARVRILTPVPGLARVQIFIRPKRGRPVMYDVPFTTD